MFSVSKTWFGFCRYFFEKSVSDSFLERRHFIVLFYQKTNQYNTIQHSFITLLAYNSAQLIISETKTTAGISTVSEHMQHGMVFSKYCTKLLFFCLIVFLW